MIYAPVLNRGGRGDRLLIAGCTLSVDQQRSAGKHSSILYESTFQGSLNAWQIWAYEVGMEAQVLMTRRHWRGLPVPYDTPNSRLDGTRFVR